MLALWLASSTFAAGAEQGAQTKPPEPLTRSYSIAPHDGRSPSVEYRDEMKAQAVNWLTDLKNETWKNETWKNETWKNETWKNETWEAKFRIITFVA